MQYQSLPVCCAPSKKAIRLITLSKHNAHTAGLFKSLEILTLENIYIMSLSMFMFKYNLRRLPPVVDELFVTNSSIHSINTRQRNLLHVPLARSRSSWKSLRFRGVMIWNQVPRMLNINVSQGAFKSSLQQYLLNGNTFLMSPL
jgi:hypothetical protein